MPAGAYKRAKSRADFRSLRAVAYREEATMTDIATGTLVKHVSLGIGKVVAVEPTAVHVFFPESEKRYAAKLRWPAARPLLTKDGVESNAWLEGLTSFALDAATGRYALAA